VIWGATNDIDVDDMPRPSASLINIRPIAVLRAVLWSDSARVLLRRHAAMYSTEMPYHQFKWRSEVISLYHKPRCGQLNMKTLAIRWPKIISKTISEIVWTGFYLSLTPRGATGHSFNHRECGTKLCTGI
jgi:hypothetical protein